MILSTPHFRLALALLPFLPLLMSGCVNPLGLTYNQSVVDTGHLPGLRTTSSTTAATVVTLEIVAGNAQSALQNATVTTSPKVRALDSTGAVVAGASVTFSPSSAGSASPSSATTGADGTAETAWTLGPSVGAQTLTALSGSATASFSATALAATIDDAQSDVTASAASVTADGSSTSTVTVTLKNATGTAIPGKVVSLTSSRGATDTVSAVSATSNASGQATFSVKSTTAGSSTYTAAVTADALTLTDTAAVTFTAGALASITFTVQPVASDADHALTTQPVLTLSDANGNTVTGETGSVTLTGHSAAGCSSAVASSTSGDSIAAVAGVATFTAATALKTSVTRIKATYTSGGTTVTACSNAITVAAGAAASIAFSTQPVASSADSALSTQPVVSVLDANANAVTGETQTVTLTGHSAAGCASAVASSTSGDSVAAISGVATFTSATVIKTSVTRLKASYTVSGGATFTACSNAISVSAGAIASIAFATQPAASDADHALTTQPVLTIKDASGNTITAQTGTVTLTGHSAAGCASAVASSISGDTVAAVAGVGTFSSATVTNTSVTRLKASYTSGGTTVTACSNALSVSAGAVASIAFSTQPVGGSSDNALTTQPILTIKDTNGNTVTGETQNVTLTGHSAAGCTSAVASSTASDTVAAVAGVGTFTAAQVTSASVTRLKASYTASGGATVTACSNAISVTAGAVASIAFSTQPVASDADHALSTQPVLTIKDAGGNTVTSETLSVTLTGHSAAGCASAVASSTTGDTVAAVAGVGTFTAATVTNTSVTRLKASYTSGGTTVTACSSAISVSAGAVASIAFSIQPVASDADSALTTQPVLTIKDASGNTVTAETGTVTLTGHSAAGCASAVAGSTANDTVAAVSGVGTFTTAKVTAVSVTRLKASYTSGGTTVTACSNAISVSAGAVASIAFSTQPVASDADSALTTQPVLTIKDASGNTVTAETGTVTLTGHSAAGCASAVAASTSGDTVAAVSGVGTFTVAKALKTSVTRIKASYTSGGTTVTACSNAITVSPGAASSLTFSTAPSATGDTDTDLSTQPAVSVWDANGNLKTDAATGISLSAYSDACSTAVVGGVTPISSTTPSSGIATFTGVRALKTNVVRLRASDGTRTVCSAALSISAGAPSATNSTLSASGPVLANNTATSTITITLKDANDNVVPSYDATTLTLTSSGSNNTIVQASGTTNASGQATATLKSSTAETKTITLSAPASLTTVSGTSSVFYSALAISPTTVTVEAGTSTTFTSTGGYSSVSFSVASGTGTVNASSGVYTAPANPATETVRATDGASNTSDSTVTVKYSMKSLNFPAYTSSPDPGAGTNGDTGSGPRMKIDSAANTTISSGSISFWFKTSNTGLAYLFSKVKSGSNHGEARVYLEAASANSARLFFEIQGFTTLPATGFTTYAINSASGLNTGTWHHFIGVFDSAGFDTDGAGPNGTIKMGMYIDGVLQASTNSTLVVGVGAPSGGTTDKDMELGRNNELAATRSYLDGNIDDMAIFDKPLDTTDASSIYNSGKPRDLSTLTLHTSGASLTHWWKMGDGDSGTCTGGYTKIKDWVGSWDACLKDTSPPTVSTTVP